MANSKSNKKIMKIDRLSDLPDDLLLTILSFLPTHIAVRTSILSRCFRHLWKISPSLELIYRKLPDPKYDNFISMATHALLDRNPFYSLLSLRLEVCLCHLEPSFLSSLLVKARFLDLRHLTIKVFPLSRCGCSSLLDVVFTINSLRSLSFVNNPNPLMCDEFNFPSEITLTRLTSLSIRFVRIDPTKFNQHLSKLYSLEDLHLHIYCMPVVRLSSQTIRKLKLIISSIHIIKIDYLSLYFPSLESIYLEIQDVLSPCHVHVEVPLLRKAVINLKWLRKRDVNVVAVLLNSISHVKELTLHLKESKDEKHPICFLLELGKDVPEFLNLEHLELILCFHEHNLEAVTMMLNNCPALRSLKLVHEIPKLTGMASGRKGKDWRSRLPRNADRNYRYAYFENLHLEENRKGVIKLLSKKRFSERQTRCSKNLPLVVTREKRERKKRKRSYIE